MSYRTRLFIWVIALVVVTNGLLAIAAHRQCDDLLHQEVHRKLRSIASTAAALLDPNLVASVRGRQDEARPEYPVLRGELQSIRDHNRREDAWIDRVFTLVPAPQDPKVVEYGVDSEERFEFVHHAGDIYKRGGAPVAIGIEGINRLAARLSNFQAGYNAAFAPVRDKSGKLIAMLAVSGRPAASSTLHELGPRLLMNFAITVVLACVVALILSWQVSKPLYGLRLTVESIGQGNLDAKVPPGMTGEFAQLAASIQGMAAGLRERDTIKRAFSGYLSRQVLETIIAKGDVAIMVSST